MSLAPQHIKVPGIQNIIGVASGKGGVGKTFVASNVAATFAKMGKKVGILDADICCPNIFKVMGISAKLTPTSENKLIPIEKWGMKIVSMAGLCGSDDEPIVWRGPILSKILQQLLKESMWGELDILVIDFPSGSSDIPLSLLQNCAVDSLIAVTTPQEMALLDAQKTLSMAIMLKVPCAGIVENMRGEIFGEGGGAALAEKTGVPFLGSIPLRKQIVALSDQGMPPIFQSEELEMIFSKIARSCLAKMPIK